MAGFKRGIHWSDEAEFKFVKTKKEILYNLLTGLKNYNFEIYCLILRKDKEIEVEKSTSVYNYMLAKLIDGIRHSDLWLMVDGAFGKEHRQKVRTYLRATLKHPIKNFKYGNSKSYNGLQLADVIAGIIHRHYSEKKDSEDLFGLIRDKIRLLDELK